VTTYSPNGFELSVFGNLLKAVPVFQFIILTFFVRFKFISDCLEMSHTTHKRELDY
jgi:hypothetical protein